MLRIENPPRPPYRRRTSPWRAALAPIAEADDGVAFARALAAALDITD